MFTRQTVKCLFNDEGCLHVIKTQSCTEFSSDGDGCQVDERGDTFPPSPSALQWRQPCRNNRGLIETCDEQLCSLMLNSWRNISPDGVTFLNLTEPSRKAARQHDQKKASQERFPTPAGKVRTHTCNGHFHRFASALSLYDVIASLQLAWQQSQQQDRGCCVFVASPGFKMVTELTVGFPPEILWSFESFYQLPALLRLNCLI